MLALVILLLVWALAWMGRDEFQHAHEDDDQIANVEHAPTEPNVVVINEEAQKQAGIAVEALRPAKYAASQQFTGVVLDLRALVEAPTLCQFVGATDWLASASAATPQ